MNQVFGSHQEWKTKFRQRLQGVILFFVLFSSFGCTYPGAKATSTIPILDNYVELGEEQESSSCGYAFLMLSLGNPTPMADIIDEMIKANGGDALINISSDSTATFFLLGSSNCVNIRGTVVKFG